MDTFEELFLLCDMKMAFTPGPTELSEPLYVDEPFEIAEYPAEEVIKKISNLKNVKLVSEGKGFSQKEFFNWNWKWETEERWINIGFTVFDTSPISYGGSPLVLHCIFTDFLELWSVLRTNYPGLWLVCSDDSENRMLRPRDFIEIFAIPKLQYALIGMEEEIVLRARTILKIYQGFLDA